MYQGSHFWKILSFSLSIIIVQAYSIYDHLQIYVAFYLYKELSIDFQMTNYLSIFLHPKYGVHYRSKYLDDFSWKCIKSKLFRNVSNFMDEMNFLIKFILWITNVSTWTSKNNNMKGKLLFLFDAKFNKCICKKV